MDSDGCRLCLLFSLTCRYLIKYNKGNKTAAIRHQYGDCGSKDIAKRWHGRMKLAPEMLNGGPNSGEVIGRGQTRMHCHPYAVRHLQRRQWMPRRRRRGRCTRLVGLSWCWGAGKPSALRTPGMGTHGPAGAMVTKIWSEFVWEFPDQWIHGFWPSALLSNVAAGAS